MTLVEEKSAPKLGFFARLFLRVPPMLYRLGLARRLGKRGILLLHSVGRRSGKPRIAGLSFARSGRTLYVVAGPGIKTGWYQNLLASPEAWIELGDQRLVVRARPVSDPAERESASSLLAVESARGGPPKPLRPLLRRFGLDFDAEHARAFADPATLTLVALEY